VTLEAWAYILRWGLGEYSRNNRLILSPIASNFAIASIVSIAKLNSLLLKEVAK